MCVVRLLWFDLVNLDSQIFSVRPAGFNSFSFTRTYLRLGRFQAACFAAFKLVAKHTSAIVEKEEIASKSFFLTLYAFSRKSSQSLQLTFKIHIDSTGFSLAIACTCMACHSQGERPQTGLCGKISFECHCDKLCT